MDKSKWIRYRSGQIADGSRTGQGVIDGSIRVSDGLG